ncbi:MAG: DUF234 domain-containing protein [Propionibacteriaceae bacterium]|jgi:AAA+ ATPase superfamily predicted ATPase|nr:DUF234 domain-containing protein [Propionibacteriaceae bacterium]
MSDNTSAFFGRRALLATLTEHKDAVAASGRGRLLGLRGRRQVGKSTVVERFVELSDTPYVFVTGLYNATTRQQLDQATRALVESQNLLPDAEVMAQTPATSWRDWLGRLALTARSGPVVAVLDEFPWLVRADPSLEGELQAQWDRTLEKLPVLLILIGSDMAMMDRLVQADRALFGRVRHLAVPALDPSEVAQALPDRDPVAAFDAYLVTGGYPRLVADLAASGRPVEDHVLANLADPYGPLVATARLSLAAEFPDPGAAYNVLAAIGASDTARPGFNDVLSAIADPAERTRAQAALVRSLKTLTEAKGLIELEQPAWAPPTSKLRRHRITDPYLRFWFRYVERHVEHISRGRADLAQAFFGRDWPVWRGHVMEPVVRQALTRLAADDPALAGVETVQPWWTRDGRTEVDLVASTPDRSAVVGAIKWGPSGRVSDRDMDQLRRQRELVPRAATARLAAVSPTGAAPAGADLAYGAADLLAAWG